MPQVCFEQEQRNQHRYEVTEDEVKGRRRVRDDVQVRCGDRCKDCYHRAGQVRADAGFLGEECATRNNKQGSNQGKVIIGADQGHTVAAFVGT